MNKNIQNIVKQTLEEYPETRKSDMELIVKVASKFAPTNTSFAYCCFMLEKKGVSFESITRARRKMQHLYPNLRDEDAQKIRATEEENYYIEYGRRY